VGELDAFDSIAQRHGLALIVQFGSTVAGRTHAGSDVDIGVLFDRRPPGYDALAAIEQELQAALPGPRVDLAVLDRADPLFLKQVLERSRLLAGAPRRYAELKIYAFKRYQDHRRFLALERAHVRRSLAGA
jgi:predicted nucleotidyltransferase